ncbi:MAG: hypothetical protein GF405_01500 [Candidatus Eisenbacteria bacterium]|nr:hypothetical protein [Candidatus Eisenbacteria bacterium]
MSSRPFWPRGASREPAPGGRTGQHLDERRPVMRLNRSALALAALAAVAAPSRSVTIRVPQDQPTIQTAIAAADSGDTVLISDGTYYEHDILMASGVTVESASGDPQYVVVDAGDLGRCFILDGVEGGEIDALTLTGGAAVGGGMDGKGGAMLCVSSSTRLEDITFAGNSAAVEGGGLYCEGGTPYVVSCHFDGNTCEGAGGGAVIRGTSGPMDAFGSNIFRYNEAERGGGLAIFGAATTNLINVCTFEGNEAVMSGRPFGPARSSGLGGGVYVDSLASLEIRSAVFTDNYAHHAGGGIYITGGGSPEVNFGRFTLNQAVTYGGGLCAEHAGAFSMAGWGVTNDYFEDNTAWHGGAVYIYDADGVTIEEHTFRDNVASERGGAVALEDVSNCSFSSCQFNGNRAQRGFALDVLGCSFLSLTGCTIADNHPWSGSVSGAVYFGESLSWSDITESIIAFNGGEAIACGASVVPDPNWNDPLDLHWMDVYGNTGGDWSGSIEGFGDFLSNISLDPRFCDMSGSENDDHDDFTLCSNSPCLADDPENPTDTLMGAHDEGPCGECTSLVEAMSWGSIKSLFRCD